MLFKDYEVKSQAQSEFIVNKILDNNWIAIDNMNDKQIKGTLCKVIDTFGRIRNLIDVSYLCI